MKISVVRVLLVLQTLQVGAFATNSVVNLSHYDLLRPDFVRMKAEGIIGVIHEATYPRLDRDSYYGPRQNAATRAGLLWGAYHFGDATDPIRQAEHFLSAVESQWRGPALHPNGILLVLDFEKNGHYPGGSMRVDQAVTFVELKYWHGVIFRPATQQTLKAGRAADRFVARIGHGCGAGRARRQSTWAFDNLLARLQRRQPTPPNACIGVFTLPTLFLSLSDDGGVFAPECKALGVRCYGFAMTENEAFDAVGLGVDAVREVTKSMAEMIKLGS